MLCAGDVDDGTKVSEVDDLGDVCRLESRGGRIAVDRDDTMAELADSQDRAPLVPAGADEENRLQRVPSVFVQVAGEPART
jgi:hypothetical protein